jgi:hypothetical protein
MDSTPGWLAAAKCTAVMGQEQRGLMSDVREWEVMEMYKVSMWSSKAGIWEYSAKSECCMCGCLIVAELCFRHCSSTGAADAMQAGS